MSSGHGVGTKALHSAAARRGGRGKRKFELGAALVWSVSSPSLYMYDQVVPETVHLQ